MWFQPNSLGSEVMMPDSFFEVEHSTDIQNSLCKFSDLQSFNARMFIVADAKRHDEFIARLSHDYFKPISDRVEFMSYDKLDRFYEGIIEYFFVSLHPLGRYVQAEINVQISSRHF